MKKFKLIYTFENKKYECVFKGTDYLDALYQFYACSGYRCRVIECEEIE